VFPGIFKGALEARSSKISDEMKIAAAISIAKLVKKPDPDHIIPGVFDKNIAKVVASAVKKYAR
ncbi:MAG: malic enzyme-like NAD(P)-binding protein, partial [Candidatus Gracilibacteria bacterium]